MKLNIWFKQRQYEYSLLKVLRLQLKKLNNFPTLAEIQLVNRCNARCIMCTYPDSIAQQQYTTMSSVLYEKLLHEFSEEPTLQLVILGFQSEPFLDNTLVERCRLFKQILPDRKLEVMTNGSLLHKTDLASLFTYIDTLHISINAYSKETFDNIMKGLTFDTVMLGVSAISKNAVWRNKTYLRLIKQRANIDEYNAFVRYWNEQGFRVFGYEINDRLGTLPNFEHLQVPVSKAKRRRFNFFKKIGSFLLPVCTVPMASAYIRANGDMVLCFNDWGEKYIMGNVQTHTVGQIYNSPQYLKIRQHLFERRHIHNPVCADCQLYSEGRWLTV